MSDQPLPLPPFLLDILRCPVAVRSTEHGPDPGRLRLVRGCWLVCDESGMKYPIRDGIAIMLIEEGEKWRDTAEAALPVPPPAA
ncbi:MAG: hypothetical protein KA170_15595 [Candidatus Promineofilum sp.]|nr:hypothetical protein [Promineifilum sp.]